MREFTSQPSAVKIDLVGPEDHSSIKQPMIYMHTSDRALHAAIDRMSLSGDKFGDNQELENSADKTELLNAAKS